MCTSKNLNNIIEHSPHKKHSNITLKVLIQSKVNVSSPHLGEFPMFINKISPEGFLTLKIKYMLVTAIRKIEDITVQINIK